MSKRKNKDGFLTVKIGDLIIDNGLVLIVLKARENGNWILFNALNNCDEYLLNRSVYYSEYVKHIPV